MDLSPSFTLEQLTFSSTALRLGLDNTPNAGEISNLGALCDTLLEPAQALLGTTFTVNSGYRSPSLNQAVGGAVGSAHMDGRAADVVPQHLSLQEAFDAIRGSALPFDQVIIECNAWIHLAISKSGTEPRHEALKATGGPGHWSYVRV